MRSKCHDAVPRMLAAQANDALPLMQWARTGLMALTGPHEGPPALPIRDYMERISALLVGLGRAAQLGGGVLSLDPHLLAERAGILRLTRHGAVSPSGTCRLLPARDGWVAVNLAREEDYAAIPAWLGSGFGEEPWSALERIVPKRNAAALAARGQLLGVPVARLGSAVTHATNGLPRLIRFARGCTVRDPGWVYRRPLVLDFSSLWAGPLCGHLFTQMGARVIKIESISRPDGARMGPAAFFDLLHAGQESLAIDFASPVDRAHLQALMQCADVVIEASRPRAFEQAGLTPELIFADNPGLTWVSITAYGRTGRRQNRVGFGDDVAVAAGLVAMDSTGDPFFVGDALADPLAGIAAATGAFISLAKGGGYLVDAAICRSAAFVATARPLQHPLAKLFLDRGRWMLACGDAVEAVATPTPRKAIGRAAALGVDTVRILNEFA